MDTRKYESTDRAEIKRVTRHFAYRALRERFLSLIAAGGGVIIECHDAVKALHVAQNERLLRYEMAESSPESDQLIGQRDGLQTAEEIMDRLLTAVTELEDTINGVKGAASDPAYVTLGSLFAAFVAGLSDDEWAGFMDGTMALRLIDLGPAPDVSLAHG